MNIYTLFDMKAKTHNRPFFLINEDVAMRTASQLANDSSSDFCRHAVDFVLYEHGSFDDVSGKWVVHDVPKPVVQLIQLKQSRTVINDLVGGSV